MNKNKQIKLPKDVRIKNLQLSYNNCHQQLSQLINKKVKTKFDLININFLQKRQSQIRLAFYMEGIPCS